MKNKIAFAFLMGFILGPIVVVEGFGHYTQWRIEKQDRETAAEMAALQKKQDVHKP